MRPNKLEIAYIAVLNIQYFPKLFVLPVTARIFYIQVDIISILHVNFMMQQLIIHAVIKIIVGKSQFSVNDLRLIYDYCPEIQVSGKKIINQIRIERIV
jgi:hypothetical protein